jgi:purine-binding chemotaxis protein CheW
MAELQTQNNGQVLDDLSGKYLTFMIQDTIYGIELLNVIEILSIQAITRVPRIPDYIKGIINLRGRIVPVIDMRIKFNQPEKSYDERTCIIVIELNDMQVGLIVDQVSEVLTVDNSELEEIPQFSSINNSQYLKSIGKLPSKLILNIDCEMILK